MLRLRGDRAVQGEDMNAAYLSAASALAGSIVGGLTSLAASWLSQQVQAKAQLRTMNKTIRQELYRDFINEASRLAADSFTHNKAEVKDFVGLYAMISRMRALSSSQVVTTAEQVVQRVIDQYLAPNLSLADLNEMIRRDENLDPLRQFAEACRTDLDNVR
ncbi:MAG TPA: hypothetical protein VME92_19700 [Acetobacteraceae bacterium]|nr:hypothetical protein [Acetobacteraceae bacterium]